MGENPCKPEQAQAGMGKNPGSGKRRKEEGVGRRDGTSTSAKLHCTWGHNFILGIVCVVREVFVVLQLA